MYHPAGQRRSSWVLVLVACLALLPAASLRAAAQGTGKAASPSAELPQGLADVASSVAKMDDRQVRASLVQLLEEKARAPERPADQDPLTASNEVTLRAGARLSQLAQAAGEAGRAPAVFWSWLTGAGEDSTAPLRALGTALVLLGIGWIAQRAAVAVAAWRGRKAPPAATPGAGITALRAAAFLAAVSIAHAVIPEVTRPSRLAGLAIVLTSFGTWLAAWAVRAGLPRLLKAEAASPNLGRVLHLSFAVLFAGLFGLVLLREAGVAPDARLLVGLAAWLAFGAFFQSCLDWRRRLGATEARDETAEEARRLEFRYSANFVRLSLVIIYGVTVAGALLRGPDAFWKGVASLALVVLAASVCGWAGADNPLTRRLFAPARSGWAATLQRAWTIAVFVCLVVALALVWGIDPLHTANAHLGQTIVRGIVTVAITLVLAYLVWGLIRAALSQSALGAPPLPGIHGEEGGGTAATRLQTFEPVLRNFLFVAVVTIALMVCLTSLGVNMAPLLAGAGVIGIALGFGAQTLVRDIISGVFFLAEDAFRIGEYIEIGNTRGTVEGIAIRSLKLRHHRGAVHTVPFGEIKQLTNNSRDWVIMKLEFLLAFDTDLKMVKRIVKEIGRELQAHPELGHALLDSVKSQGVRRMEPTGMVVGLKFMARPGSEVFLLRREIYQRVRDAFEQNGIHFARPQVVVAGGTASPALLEQAAAAGLSSGEERRPQG